MSDQQDSEFYTTFKGGMDVLGLPAPSSLFGSLTTAIASMGTMANAIKTCGSKASIREVILTVPLAGGSTAAIAAGLYEVGTALGGMAAAFYIGACVGCLLGAAFSVYGTAALTKVAAVARQVEQAVGESLFDLFDRMYKTVPRFGSLQSKTVYLGIAGLRRPSPRGRRFA